MQRGLGLTFLEVDKFINHRKMQKFVKEALEELVNEEFFNIAASSSGKYHPSYALGDGGLLRHTKATVMIAHELFPLYSFCDVEKDLICAALYLHDIEKPSKLHPVEAKFRLEKLRNHSFFNDVIDLIESHMGQWDNHGKLPKPKTELQKFVHLCDYLASRKMLEVKFD